MIERKIDKAGNVTGFWDTDSNKWVKPTDDFDVTTDETGTRLDDQVAQERVERRQEEIDAALEEADPERAQAAQEELEASLEDGAGEEEAHDGDTVDGPTDAVPELPNNPSKEDYKRVLRAHGITFPKDATKLQLSELYAQTQDDNFEKEEQPQPEVPTE